MKKVICYSLWGCNKKYTVGAIKNAEEISTVYPGWLARFYCATSVPSEIITQLMQLNAEIVQMPEEGDWNGMFWRFQAIADDDVGVMLSRDTDSRLTTREALAVDEWLHSKKNFHIMRDHPSHSTKILGGMWGARKPILRNITKLIERYNKGNYWQVDQDFLRTVIWPRIRFSAFIHDPFFDKKPFPVNRVGTEFVGKVWDENENTIIEHEQILLDYIKTHGEKCIL